LIDRKTAESVELRIQRALNMMDEIDRIMALPDSEERESALESMLNNPRSLEAYSMSTVCEKKELEWPTRFIRMNLFKIIKTLMTRSKQPISHE